MKSRFPGRGGPRGTPAVGGLFSRLLAFGLVAVMGCTGPMEYVHNHFKVGPNYGRPPAPVAEDWIDANDVRLRKDSEEHRRWWTVFNDPVLNALVCDVYNQNLTLREAGFRVLEARAELGIAVGNFFPQTQDAFGSYNRYALSKRVANRQFIAQRFYDQWQVGTGLAWELDFWGKFRRAIEAADADLDASIENYDDVLVMLLGETAETYVLLRTYQQELEYVKTNVQLQTETLKIAEARFRGGQTSELDVDQAKGDLQVTKSLVPQFEIRIREATNRLCVLLGIPPEELQRKLGPAPIPTAPVDVAVGIPADLLTRRPDIRKAERIAAGQCARIGVAVAELYPHISINGTVGFTAQEFTGLFKGTSLQGNVGPSFQWNILNYGRLINNVRLQDARFQELVTNYQNTVLKAGEEVENGIIRFLRSQQRVIELKEAVAANEAAVKVAIVQYRGGTVDFNRVALLQEKLVERMDELASSRGEICRGLIHVYRALGGGWQIRLDGCAPRELGQSPVEGAPATPSPAAPTPPAPESVPVPLPSPTSPTSPPRTENRPASIPTAIQTASEQIGK